MSEEKKLMRSNTNKVIAGVLGGLAEYLSVDPTMVRIVYTILTLCTAAFPGLLIYIIMLLIMPVKIER